MQFAGRLDDGDMAADPTTGGGEGGKQGAGAAEEAVAPAGAGDEDEGDGGGGVGGKLLQVRKRSFLAIDIQNCSFYQQAERIAILWEDPSIICGYPHSLKF